jgi:hypothetical protein
VLESTVNSAFIHRCITHWVRTPHIGFSECKGAIRAFKPPVFHERALCLASSVVLTVIHNAISVRRVRAECSNQRKVTEEAPTSVATEYGVNESKAEVLFVSTAPEELIGVRNLLGVVNTAVAPIDFEGVSLSSVVHSGQTVPWHA